MARPRRKTPAQLDLALRPVFGWGGARPGAGRKPKPGRRSVAHRARPVLAAQHPVHVTLRMAREVPNLRTKQLFNVVRGAFRRSASRAGFRVVHYSVQSNHVHLLVEAQDKDTLRSGVVGMQVRIARGVNVLLSRRGKVFGDRYHAHVLETPREVRNALAYVLLNARKHAAEQGRRLKKCWLDPFSSASCFDGWRGVLPYGNPNDAGIATAKTWLLAKGWRRRGLLRFDEIPGLRST